MNRQCTSKPFTYFSFPLDEDSSDELFNNSDAESVMYSAPQLTDVEHINSVDTLADLELAASSAVLDDVDEENILCAQNDISDDNANDICKSWSTVGVQTDALCSSLPIICAESTKSNIGLQTKHVSTKYMNAVVIKLEVEDTNEIDPLHEDLKIDQTIKTSPTDVAITHSPGDISTVVIKTENDHQLTDAYPDKKSTKSSYFDNLGGVKQFNDSSEKYKCEKCNVEFESISDFVYHQTIHAKQNLTYKCEKCDVQFKLKSSFLYHKKMLHPKEKKIYKCPLCNMQFGLRSLMYKHQATHAEEKTVFTCDICGVEFGSKSNMNRHMISTHSKKKFECEMCHKELSDNSGLRRHKRSVHTHVMYDCTLCVKRFNSKSVVCGHRSEHLNTVYSCEMCNKEFIQENDVCEHIIIEEKLYECKVCHKTFRRPCFLTDHMWIHTGEKNFTCNICSKSFSRKAGLGRHIRNMHTDEREFQCTFCDKRFAEKHLLARHINIHTKEKLYTCNICGKAYHDPSHLHEHIQRHNKERSEQELKIEQFYHATMST